LPDAVPLADAARNAGRAALLVEALGRRPDLLFDATQDWLHQEYRRPAMVQSLELVESLRADGWAAVVSGAGPSVLVLTAGEADVPAVDGWDLRALAVDMRGATVVHVGSACVSKNAHEGYDTVAIGHED
jgi:homoserine kinase